MFYVKAGELFPFAFQVHQKFNEVENIKASVKN